MPVKGAGSSGALRTFLGRLSISRRAAASSSDFLRAERSGPDHNLSERSALQEVSHQFGIPVITIASLNDVLDVVQSRREFSQYRDAVMAYRAQYGVMVDR